SVLIALAAMAILGIVLSAAIIDRRSKRELRRQEVLLDTALENMSQGLCMFDAEGRVMLYNERYAVMMGLDRPPRKGESAVEILQRQQAAGQWEGNAPQYIAELIEEIRAGRTVTRVIVRTKRSIRVVHQPMVSGGGVGRHIRGRHRMGTGAAADFAHGASRCSDQFAEPDAVPRAARPRAAPCQARGPACGVLSRSRSLQGDQRFAWSSRRRRAAEAS